MNFVFIGSFVSWVLNQVDGILPPLTSQQKRLLVILLSLAVAFVVNLLAYRQVGKAEWVAWEVFVEGVVIFLSSQIFHANVNKRLGN